MVPPVPLDALQQGVIFCHLGRFLVHLSLGVFLGNPTEKDALFLRKGQRGAWEGLGAVFASLWLAARTFLILGS